jgi:Ca-activated chloride channel family protein
MIGLARTATAAVVLTAACSRYAAPPPDPASGHPTSSAAPATPATQGREDVRTSPAPSPPVIAVDPEPEPERPDVRVDTGPTAWIGAEATSRYLWSAELEHEVAIWVNVPAEPERPRLPTAVVMTVDTSGSMAGVKIHHAREAARTVLEQLAEGDMLALHSFAAQVRQHSQLLAVHPHTRLRFLGAIDRFRANGATNLFGAARRATLTAASAPPTHPVRRVILISDGRATVGPGSPRQMAKLGDDGIAQGVQITALGIGLDYDEHTLNALAEHSSGRLYHLASTVELPAIIEEELSLVRTTVATNAFVEVVPAPGVTIYPPRWGHHTLGAHGSIRFPLGSLYAGQEREFVIRLRLRSRAPGEHALLSARLHFVDHQEGGLARVQETLVRAALTDDEGLALRSLNQRAHAIVSTFQAADLADSAARDANAGRLEQADRQLAQAEAQLRTSSRRASSPKLRHRLAQSADSLAAHRRKVQSARVAPAAKRKQQSRASSLELNDWSRSAAGF